MIILIAWNTYENATPKAQQITLQKLFIIIVINVTHYITNISAYKPNTVKHGYIKNITE